MMKKMALLVAALLIGTLAFTQVEGDVVDEQNKGVTNAIVIATDTLKKVSDTVKTDGRGFYIFKTLKPGVHKIEAKATGFLTTIQFFKVSPAPAGANESDDTYFAETLDFILTRSKVPK